MIAVKVFFLNKIDLTLSIHKNLTCIIKANLKKISLGPYRLYPGVKNRLARSRAPKVVGANLTLPFRFQ